MKTENIARIEVHTVMLQEGVDYEEAELVADQLYVGVWMLTSERLQEIAKNNGFDRCSWSDHILPNSINQHEIRVQFERTLKE